MRRSPALPFWSLERLTGVVGLGLLLAVAFGCAAGSESATVGADALEVDQTGPTPTRTTEPVPRPSPSPTATLEDETPTPESSRTPTPDPTSTPWLISSATGPLQRPPTPIPTSTPWTTDIETGPLVRATATEAERLPLLRFAVEPEAILITAAGYTLPIVGGAPGAWEVMTPCQNEATLSGGTPISSATVVIDPGHGGDESGAVGPTGLVEADVNLDVALRVAALMEGQNIDVVLTRDFDYRTTIAVRAAIASALAPEVFLSIHHNGGSPEPIDEPGTEVYFQARSTEAERLGGLLYEELVGALNNLDIQWTGNRFRGAQWRLNAEESDLYGVLRRPVGVVSALTEAMFITSPVEEELLRNEAVLQMEAEALVRAVTRFLETDDSGSGVIEGVVFEGDLGGGGGPEGCVDPVLE